MPSAGSRAPHSKSGARSGPPSVPVRIEVDLRHEVLAASRLPFLRSLEGLIGERPVEERGNLLQLTSGVLHALGRAGFRRVDHWESDPGGWLPLPERTHPGIQEPLQHLLRALERPEWRAVATAREFAMRLSDATGRRVDAVVRRSHRERSHTVSLLLTGRVAPSDARRVVGAIRAAVPVLRAQVTQGIDA